MPFLRFSRDKRGIESFSLVQATANRRGKVRPRVLYWYRTPPDIKVGREPFDPEVRKALEKQNPDVQFDWRAIIDTPIPSADADKWRERRRAERAAKQAARQEAAEEPAATDDDAAADETAPAELGASESDATDAADAPAEAVAGAPAPHGAPRTGDPNRKRRRRRRGGARNAGAPAPGSAPPSAPPPPSNGEPSGD